MRFHYQEYHPLLKGGNVFERLLGFQKKAFLDYSLSKKGSFELPASNELILFFFEVSIFNASSEYSGAIIISKNKSLVL